MYQDFSVIQLTNYVINKIKDRFVVIFTESPKWIYKNVHLRIGTPIMYEHRLKNELPEDSFIPLIPYQALSSFMSSQRNENAKEAEEDKDSMSDLIGSSSLKLSKDEYYTPIKWLTTFTYDWKIKARVLKKSEIKNWRNPRSAGKLMNIELIDMNGTQILATFFNDAVDKFDSMLHENKVYVFTNGTVKIANKKFTSVKNDFSLIFDRNSLIERVEDDSKINTMGFHFFNVKQIEQMKEITTIDFIGVVHYVGPITNINLKNGSQKERRNVIMADDTGLTINLCFWGEHAAMSDYPDNPVIALKAVRVSDYSGRSLNSSEDCTLLLNPDIERSHKLRKWYDSLESTENLRCISFDASKVNKENGRNNERVSWLMSNL
jgi:replication factor A1